jgi:hemerythrin superfamily protein
MARTGNGTNWAKWGLIGGAVAGGVALIPLIPAIKRRAMRVTTILKKDHRVVSGLIATLQMAPKVNERIRKRLFEQIRHSVMVHALAEEEILYPAMRNYMGMDGDSKVSEAYHEHQVIKDLLSDLETMDPLSDAFDRKFEDLKNKIEHHVEEEESEMFEMLLQRMPEERQQELGRQIHDRKKALKMKIAA